ncbi:Na+/H+ antiporter NhaA [Sphingobacterium sp. FBM7-1]|uniref:Na+/H+ antiporter NhaA n=1 Tax=Sphingobacterium sp. FBM7-1 TaxID=2886688 RepID=UPI001D126DF4|nr:Na+/H+ antiporter NhaA [Sphingobacterium sp. FBM7-1]
MGKPIGIFLMTKLAIASGICSKPQGASWRHILDGTSFNAASQQNGCLRIENNSSCKAFMK